MAKIIKILKDQTRYYDEYCVVVVLLDDGTEAFVRVGGDVEVFFDHRYNKIKAVVKRAQSRK